jgi:general secretion pathway protein K
VKAPTPTTRGVALILVIFIVALASTIVINLAYSTHLSSRRNNMVERGFQAEYVLKSAINFARVLLQNDKTDEDSAADIWGAFLNGQIVPAEMLGINQPNVRIELEIRPEASKIPLRQLVPSTGTPEVRWRDALARLFKNLGFDEDESEVDHTGIFPGRHFLSEELVSLLIDYMDQDNEPYDPIQLNQTAFAVGVEGKGTRSVFTNERIARLGELSTIPGFTPKRVRMMTPFLTATNSTQININTAPKEVLRVLNEDINDQMLDEIVSFRSGAGGPFKNRSKLAEIVGNDISAKISSLVDIQGKYFQVLAKVDYETSTFFARAFLEKGPRGELPEIRSLELF